MFDQYSKIFTLKVQFVSYKERAGIRPGQISKLEKLTGKIGRLDKAVEDADLKGVKEFGSDLKKLGMPLEHSPQVIAVLLDSFSLHFLANIGANVFAIPNTEPHTP